MLITGVMARVGSPQRYPLDVCARGPVLVNELPAQVSDGDGRRQRGDRCGRAEPGRPHQQGLEHDEEFHFVLLNFIEKDNRIPPKGFNKAAYTADGAFIIPHDPKDTDYPDGQNWDVTPYTFTIPPDALAPVQVTATLLYQTFNREYMEFLRDHDVEPTQSFGGRARDLPAGGQYANLDLTWGEVIFKLWEDSGQGPPVEMGQARFNLSFGGDGGGNDDDEDSDSDSDSDDDG